MPETALLIVDMVYDFTNPKGKVFYPANETIIPGIRKILHETRRGERIVVFMQHRYRKNKIEENLNNMRPCCIEGTEGVEIDERLKPEAADYIIPKRRYSSFYGTDLDLVLRENNIKNVIIVGTKTNCCIHATALDSYYRNYNTIVVSDCVATSNEEVNNIYLKDIHNYIGTVMDCSAVISKMQNGKL